MKLILNAIKQTKITIFITAFIALYGLYSYYFIPKQENPDVKAPDAIITTTYLGASPEVVEEQVTKRIEEAVSEIHGFRKVESWSSNSFSLVWVTLKHDADIDKAWDELRRSMNDVIPNLPKQAERPVIDTKVVETAGIILSLSGEKYSYDQLANFAKEFRRELSSVGGIARFKIAGEIERVVNVSVDTKKLRFLNLSLYEIAEILKTANLNLPVGELRDDNIIIPVETNGSFKSLSEIENTVLLSDINGNCVRLKDVAKISIGDYKNYAEKFKRNSKNSILLAGYFKQDENVLIIGDEVRKVLDRIKKDFPDELQVDEVIFEPEDIANSIENFMNNLLQGVALVIIVVFLGMGFRNAVVVSMAIPLSILITFSIMKLMGIKVHQISTAALIISLGLLVDNAIVIVEAIQVRIEEGMDNIKAAFEGTKASAIPILTSTLTTIAAFLPLLSIPGASGQFVISIPQLVIISLSASYAVAIIFIPVISALLFKKPYKERKHDGFVRVLFTNGLNIALKRKARVIIISLTMLVLTVILSDLLNKQFFPYADKNIVYIDIYGNLPNIKKTESIVNKIESVLSTEKVIESYTSGIGCGLPKYYLTASTALPSPNYAQIVTRVNLENSESFDSYTGFRTYLQSKLDSLIYDAKVSVKLLESTDPKEGSVIIRVSGNNINRIKEVAGELKKEMEEVPGTIKIQDDIYYATQNYNITLDKDAAAIKGFSNYDIQAQLNYALRGRKNNKVLERR